MIGSLAVCMFCAAALGRRHKVDLEATLDDSEAQAEPSANPLAATAAALTEVFKSPLAMTVGGLVVLGALVSTI